MLFGKLVFFVFMVLSVWTGWSKKLKINCNTAFSPHRAKRALTIGAPEPLFQSLINLQMIFTVVQTVIYFIKRWIIVKNVQKAFSTLKVASSKVSLYIPVIMSKDLHLLPDLTPPKKSSNSWNLRRWKKNKC